MAVKVAAAVITDAEGRILICRRPEGKHLSLFWEFPGGKLEKGETAEVCAARECLEELDTDIEIRGKLYEAVHSYPDRTVNIIFFSCTVKSGEPVNKEHAEIKWVHPDELVFYDFCPADRDIVKKLSGIE